MTTPDIAATTYFDRLPRATLPALQNAWDKARTGKFNKGSIFKVLCKDFAEIGEDLPPAEAFNVWIALVERGEIERPTRETTPQTNRKQLLIDAKAKVDAKADTVVVSGVAPFPPVADPLTVEPIQVEVRTEPPIVALKNAVHRLADELFEQLQINARQTSREQAASILRDVAAELEAAE